MPSLNVPVQRLKVAILPMDLPCSGLVTPSGEIPTTVWRHKKMPDGFFPKTTKHNETYSFEAEWLLYTPGAVI